MIFAQLKQNLMEVNKIKWGQNRVATIIFFFVIIDYIRWEVTIINSDCISNAQVNVYKDPVSDHSKLSKKGHMTLEFDDSGHYVTQTEGTGDPAKVMKLILSQMLVMMLYNNC